MHAPNEMLILRPGPVNDEDTETAVLAPPRTRDARLR